MPPKAKDGKGKKKKKKGGKPAWMSDELWDLVSDLQRLQEFWSGELKDVKVVKPGDKPLLVITRTEAGLYILQLLYPSNKATKALRLDAVKLGVVETSVKVLASQKPADMVSAAHILAVMADTVDQSRQVMMDSKPPVIPQVLVGLATQDGAPLRAALCALLRVLATRDEFRPRLWRQLREWDWTPLVACLQMQELSQLGGRNAAHDCGAVLEALCSAPEGEVGSQACNHVVKAGGIQALVSVLKARNSHPMARAAGVAVLNQIMRRATASVCEEVVIGAGGLEPLVNLLSLPVVPLPYKAHTAAVLLRFILPDSLWKNAALLARPKTDTTATGAAVPGAAGLAPLPLAGEAVGGPPAPPAIADVGAAGTARMDLLTQQVTHALEGSSASQGTPGSRPDTAGALVQEPVVPDEALLDDATKQDIAMRAAIVAQAGALKHLVQLCVGPEGPLPDLEAPPVTPGGESTDGGALTDGGKKKKKKKSKKKKAKLLPGMAEAQTWASAVLRMISLDAEQRPAVVAAGAVRYLLPLLMTKVHPARWNARQTLLNLSMSPALVPQLQLYKVPNYVHGANIPTRHFDRPFPATGIIEAGLQTLPPHLAAAAAAAHKDIAAKQAGVAAGFKPPVMKGSSARSPHNSTRQDEVMAASKGSPGLREGAVRELGLGVQAMTLA